MNIEQIQNILNKQKDGVVYSFEELKPFLKKVTGNCYWEFDYEEHFKEHLPSWCCNYSNLDDEKVKEMFKDVSLYIVTQWTCTDTSVGSSVAEYKGDICFSIHQKYRKNGTWLEIHNEELFKQFIKDLENCHTPDEDEIKSFQAHDYSASRILFVYEYDQGGRSLFLDDNEIIRKVVSAKNVKDEWCVQKVSYLKDGDEVMWNGKITGRYIGTSLDNQEFKNYLIDKSIFELIGDKVYNQYGNVHWTRKTTEDK